MWKEQRDAREETTRRNVSSATWKPEHIEAVKML